jgi:hypothetical protein
MNAREDDKAINHAVSSAIKQTFFELIRIFLDKRGSSYRFSSPCLYLIGFFLSHQILK